MGLLDSDRGEEIMLVIGDSLQGANKKWLYLLLGIFIMSIPVYHVVKISTYNIEAASYRTPKIIGQGERAPLELVENGFIKIDDTNYSRTCGSRTATLIGACRICSTAPRSPAATAH